MYDKTYLHLVSRQRSGPLSVVMCPPYMNLDLTCTVVPMFLHMIFHGGVGGGGYEYPPCPVINMIFN